MPVKHKKAATPNPLFTTLWIESRFFPNGLSLGQTVEISGPENTGKTFLLSYIIVRLLHQHPSKKAVLINTSHQFSLTNLVMILANALKIPIVDEKNEKIQAKKLAQDNLYLKDCLDRLILINCYNAEEFFLTVLHEEYSQLKKRVMHDPDIALVAVDTVDNYSFTEAIPKNADTEVINCLKRCVGNARTPIICTSIRGSSSFETQKSLDTTGTAQTRYYSNIRCDYASFSHSIVLEPVSQAEKEKFSGEFNQKINHFVTAYLRSKCYAHRAGSVANQHVKFSIFSDMLWVV